MFWAKQKAKKKQAKTTKSARTTRDLVRQKNAERSRQQSLQRRDVPIPPCQDPARRKRLEKDDAAWLRWYFGVDCPNPFSRDFTADQLEWIREVRRVADCGGDKAMAAPRGEGKTSILERLGEKFALEGRIDFLVLFGATGSAAEASLDSIKEDLATNDRLAADYPEVCIPVRALEGTPNRAHYQTVSGKRHDNGQEFVRASSKFKWCGHEVVLPKVPGSPSANFVIATRGLDAAVRGLKRKGKRPKLVIIDDPDTENSAISESQTAKLEKRIDKSIGGLGDQKRPIARVMITTVSTRICVSARYTDPKIKPSWAGKVYRLLVAKPLRLDLWLEYVSQRDHDQQNGDPEGRTAHKLYVDNFEVMNAGAAVSNPYRFDGTILADGTARELSTLQRYYNEVQRIGQEAVSTEYDNDPPAEDADVERLLLTAHHIQTNCLSGLDRRVVPVGTVLITRAGDIQKLGVHHVTIAWDVNAVGAIIDYDFWPFVGAEGRAASDCELLILEGLWAWHASLADNPYHDVDGHEQFADLTLIDMGWKDKSWSSQPVQVFCNALGNRDFLPSKGIPNYRKPETSKRLIIGDQWHVAWPNGAPIVETNPDHWKMKAHEGFLAERGQPGSLSVFEPPRKDGRANRNAHLSFAKHVLSETWETRPMPGFKGRRTGWWKSGKPNHWFDALYGAIVARSLKGLSTLGGPQSAHAPPPRQHAAAPGPSPSRRMESPSIPNDEPPRTARRRIDFRRR